MRLLPSFCLIGLLASAVAVRAAPTSSFDLVGPTLDVTVTHDGVTLPLERVPNLAEGDLVKVKLNPLPGTAERYRMIGGFLSGAVNRPGKDWFHEAESWKPKSADLSLTVPKGAQQLALFITPEGSGSAGAVIGAVRKQPGAFVRATQELNQASLDRARLDAFLAAMQQAEHKGPETVASVSPALTRALAIKLKAECLTQPAQTQAACLTGDRETLLLADSHSSALADTLTGTPTDLAFQLSATPQAGYGLYSSYIGVVRDLFRLFGAFQSTQLQFIPALAQMRDGHVGVLLNTPLSFAKPTSVMVVALPLVEAPKPPPLQRPAPDAALCARAGVVFPVEGAPLVFATAFAHDMTVTFKQADGSAVSAPVRADPSVGGFVLDGAMPAGTFGATIAAQLHGNWGFAPFDGPAYTLSTPDNEAWKAAERTSLVVGRDNDVELLGGAAGCVTKVEMRRGDGPTQPLTFKQSGAHGIVVTVPLDKADPGPVSILVDGTGRSAPATVTLRAYQEVGSLDDLVLHAGDDEALLTGTRLDQVQAVTVGTMAFEPGGLSRVGKQDRLTLIPTDPAQVRALVAGKSLAVDVTFAGNRHKALSITIGPRRPAVGLVRVTAQSPVREGQVPITLPPGGVFAQDARLSFAFHLEGSAPLSGRETIEIATLDGRATATIASGKGYDLQDATTGIVGFSPLEALGALAYGPLRFRVVRDGAATAWTPLATVVRLPEIRSVRCARECQLTGNRLFLIKAIAPSESFRDAQDVPDGFVATEITLRTGGERQLYLRLRDAPEVVASVAIR